MNICNIEEEGRYGGPQRRTVEVAKEIKKFGIQTTVYYSLYDSEKFKKELNDSNIKCKGIDIIRLSLEPRIFFRYIITFFKDIIHLYSIIKNGDYDLVQINGTPQYKGAIASKLAGVPVVWILEDTEMPFVIRNTTRILARYLASGIVVTGKSVYDYYIKNSIIKNIKNIEIHAPVDTKVFNPKSVEPDKSMMNRKKINIVTVAGVSPVKGLDYFIKMASQLVKNDKKLLFFVAGAELSSQKTYSKMIKSLIRSSNLNDENYKYYGMIDNVQSFLAGADIFVCSSITEAGPMTVWEAMSMGKAVVTTDVGSVRQYIEDGISGYIVPVGDTKALINKVQDLILNPELAKKMGIVAREVAKEKLDVLPAAQKYADFYKQVLFSS
tara:strand:+ start:3152 stop:4297 length:1146 start_codon:yes stop_codon:yes gene_type:complete